MSVITANRNFLSSLGITDSSSFFSSFGDLATFETYCDSIGYDYDINENGEIILIDPDGKSISTGVILETTATPTITYDSTTFTVDVTGNGTVTAYVDGTETQMPHTFTQGSEDVTYVVTATAQEPNKSISLVASENCLVPAAAIKDYMKLSVINESGNDGDITITIPSYIKPAQATSLSYSKDGSNWTDTAVDSTNQTITIPVNAGDEVYLKGIATQWDESKINSTANINASGNIMSLLYGDNFENQTSFPSESKFAFYRLFKDNTHLVSITNLELPATTLAQNCYNSMFQGCTSLTSAPDLPATTLAHQCYKDMFNGCTSLNSITMLAEDISAASCLSNWVSGVAATGTFTKAASMTSLPAGANGIPNGWTVVDYQG